MASPSLAAAAGNGQLHAIAQGIGNRIGNIAFARGDCVGSHGRTGEIESAGTHLMHIMRPSSAQRWSCGKTLPGLTSQFRIECAFDALLL